MSDSDESLKAMLSRFFGSISKDIDKRFDNILSTIEEKWSPKNYDAGGNEHVRLSLEQKNIDSFGRYIIKKFWPF
jgi:hypothetical protein